MNPHPGYTATDHVFTVPLDHAHPDGPGIEVFARSLVDPARAGEDLPWLVYLQGGPGGKSPRPTRGDGWLARAMQDHRVLLLDQRGTGRSSPITPTVAASFPDPVALAAYLTHFRADSIVRDCEYIRAILSPDRPWTTLGQSYGGFITLTYLSLAPQGLRAAYITGGLPGLGATPEDIYARTYPLVRDRNADYYRRYPQDAKVVRGIADHLDAEDVRLPDGDRLTARRFRTVGMQLGMCEGLERMHWLLDEAWDGERLSDVFLHQVMALTGFIGNPLYAALQEPIFPGSNGWAAERVLPRFGEFAADADPLLLTGEMIYPWMFEEITALRPFAEAARLLVEKDDRLPLYDLDRLRANEVPVAAVVYHDDIYVPVDLSLETAREVGNVQVWVTNEWEHDGLVASGGSVLDRLMRLITPGYR